MAVRKLNGQWIVEFELRGHRVFRRLPTGASKGQANELETRLRSELIEQAVLGHAPTVSIEWAIQEWFQGVVVGRKDEKATESKVRLVKPVVAGLMLTKAGVVEAAGRILKMPRSRGEGPFSAATLNRRLSVLKATCTWAWKAKHWTAENLSPYVAMIDKKKERVRRVMITQAEVERLLRHGRNLEARAFIALGVYGLMRQGEIMAAEPSDIVRGGLKLPDSKTGPRVVPVLAELKPFLTAIPFKHHVRTLYAWFEEARDAAGLRPDLVHHDLRRSGATILLNAGVPLEVVAHILGDSIEVARTVYAHVLNRTAAKAMRKGFRPIKNPSAKSRVGVTS